MRGLSSVLALVVALVAPASAGNDARGGPAAASGTWSVSGRLHEEGRTPKTGDRPLAGVTVMVGPSSPELLTRLEDIKAHARDSAQTYRTSGSEVRRAVEAYERRLDEQGMAELLVRVTTGPDGTFSAGNLPAGRWLLVAMNTARVTAQGPPQTRQERLSFRGNGRLRGYDTFTIWLRELDLTGEGAPPVELTDRNVWFTAIQEDRGPDAGR